LLKIFANGAYKVLKKETINIDIENWHEIEEKNVLTIKYPL